MPQERHEPGEGARLLHELEQSGEYVFHGSPTPEIAELETRQAYDWKDGAPVEDGPPAVVATPYADIAIFRSLVYLDSTSFGVNDDRLSFQASPKALELARGRTGFVYVMPKSQFAPKHGDVSEMDWRSPVNQPAVRIVEVSEADLPPDIEIINPEE